MSADLTDSELISRLRRLENLLAGERYFEQDVQALEAFIVRYQELVRDYEWLQAQIGRLELGDDTP